MCVRLTGSRVCVHLTWSQTTDVSWTPADQADASSPGAPAPAGLGLGLGLGLASHLFGSSSITPASTLVRNKVVQSWQGRHRKTLWSQVPRILFEGDGVAPSRGEGHGKLSCFSSNIC